MFGEMVAGSGLGRSGLSAVCARGGASLPVPFVCTTSTSLRLVVVFYAGMALGGRRYTPGVCWLGTRATEEMVEDKGLKYGKHVPRTSTVLANLVVDAMGRSTSFLNARTEEEIISCIRKEMETGNLPENVAFGMEELYHNYQNAVMQSGDPLAKDVILTNMATVLDRILLDVEDPFTFSAYHRAVRAPFDYYIFGQNYIRPLIDFRRSYVGNISLFKEIEEKLHQGHNVVLVSNHQTEADPAFIALLLETTNSHIAEQLTYVAGDRVVTDPLCKPFSMGRNLICVYSKKHLYDIPELVEMKKKANTKSLKAMALLLREGGKIIWIAPSGGRDRPDPVTGECHPAPFDASSVDNIRRLADHSSLQGHVYPLALLGYDVMPPPPQVEKQIGERRSVAFHGIGLSIGPEVNFEDFASSSSEEAKMAYSQALYSSVTEQYNVLKSAIYEHKGLSASNNLVSLSQPWK